MRGIAKSRLTSTPGVSTPPANVRDPITSPDTAHRFEAFRLPRVLASLSVVARGDSPAAGLYLTDTFPGTVLRAAAGQFAGHEGEVIVGSEVKGLIWLVAPRGKGFRTTLLPTNLTATAYNLEGATFVP